MYALQQIKNKQKKLFSYIYHYLIQLSNCHAPILTKSTYSQLGNTLRPKSNILGVKLITFLLLELSLNF